MSEMIDLDIDDILAETDKAWLVSIGGDEHWLPKSMCEIYNDQVTMPEWLAEKKGLI